MITYNSILFTLAFEGLVKSYVVPKYMKKNNLDETGTFYLLMGLLVIFAVFEFFFLSKCLNSESMSNVLGDHPMIQLVILLVVSLVVNYKWVMEIYNKYKFWPCIGILSLVAFANEFNNPAVTMILRTVTNTECSN